MKFGTRTSTLVVVLLGPVVLVDDDELEDVVDVLDADVVEPAEVVVATDEVFAGTVVVAAVELLVGMDEGVVERGLGSGEPPHPATINTVPRRSTMDRRGLARELKTRRA